MVGRLLKLAEVYARPPRQPGQGPGLRPGVGRDARTVRRGWTSLSWWYRHQECDHPWRCLWRGSVQMTMTRPCRRITRHLLQIRLTLGLTFTGYLFAIASTSLVPVDDAATSEVVRGEWLDDPALDFDGPVFFGHVLRYLTSASVTGSQIHRERFSRSRQPRFRQTHRSAG